MENYLRTYNELKAKHKEIFDLWENSNISTSGELMNKIKDIESKIEELEILCPALIKSKS